MHKKKNDDRRLIKYLYRGETEYDCIHYQNILRLSTTMQFTSIIVFLVCLLVLLGLFTDNQVDAAPLPVQKRAQLNTKLHAKKHLAPRHKRDLDEDEQLDEEERFLNDDDNVEQDFDKRSFDESEDSEDQDFDKRSFEESEDSEDQDSNKRSFEESEDSEEQEVRADDSEEGYLPAEDAVEREFDDDMEKREFDLSEEESDSDEKRK